jgi:hypothetical protein
MGLIQDPGNVSDAGGFQCPLDRSRSAKPMVGERIALAIQKNFETNE